MAGSTFYGAYCKMVAALALISDKREQRRKRKENKSLTSKSLNMLSSIASNGNENEIGPARKREVALDERPIESSVWKRGFRSAPELSCTLWDDYNDDKLPINYKKYRWLSTSSLPPIEEEDEGGLDGSGPPGPTWSSTMDWNLDRDIYSDTFDPFENPPFEDPRFEDPETWSIEVSNGFGSDFSDVGYDSISLSDKQRKLIKTEYDKIYHGIKPTKSGVRDLLHRVKNVVLRATDENDLEREVKIRKDYKPWRKKYAEPRCSVLTDWAIDPPMTAVRAAFSPGSFFISTNQDNAESYFWVNDIIARKWSDEGYYYYLVSWWDNPGPRYYTWECGLWLECWAAIERYLRFETLLRATEDDQNKDHDSVLFPFRPPPSDKS